MQTCRETQLDLLPVKSFLIDQKNKNTGSHSILNESAATGLFI